MASRGTDEFMAEALRLAARGLERVSPNPMVGAVAVQGGRIVGRGYHHAWGKPHAEVEALRDAGPDARGSTLYITLEPCAHHGKTPPCTDAILRAGVSRVIYAADDPNPATAGRGPAILRRAGIQVERGVLEQEARDLNRPYFHWRTTGRPWVIAKWAMTLDGKIATRSGESRWITGPAARAWAHRLRRRADGILVGTRTLAMDDPLLSPRPDRGRAPTRIVLDRLGRLPLSLKFFQETGRRICAISPRVSARRRKELERKGIEVLIVPEVKGRLSLPRILEALGAGGICQILVEGGGELLGSLFDSRLVQEVAAFIAPTIIGGGGAPCPVGGEGIQRIADALCLEKTNLRRIGEDFLLQGLLVPQSS